MTDPIVGIDLGTTNSEIAIYQEGRPLVLADERGRVMLPSVVGLSETGELLVGEEARNQFMLYPERTVRSIKRRMGTDARVRLGERDYAPQEISAIILSRLKEMAQRQLGGPVRRAVITVPSVPMTMRHCPPGSLALRVLKDDLVHAHDTDPDRCRGWRRHERRPEADGCGARLGIA